MGIFEKKFIVGEIQCKDELVESLTIPLSRPLLSGCLRICAKMQLMQWKERVRLSYPVPQSGQGGAGCIRYRQG